MWVLRRIPVDETSWDEISPWKGCLCIDKEGRVWFATDLAKPTQFTSVSEADDCAHDIMIQFPGSEIQVAVYEEIFQKLLPISTTQSVTTVKDAINVPDWDWNNIPF